MHSIDNLELIEHLYRPDNKTFAQYFTIYSWFDLFILS